MEDFIVYLLQSSLCLSFFVVVYRLFLFKLTSFKFNRFFLLAGVLISFVIPSVQFSYDVVIPYVAQTATLVQDFSVLEGTTIEMVEYEEATSISIWYIVGIIYLLGMLCILLRNLFLSCKLNQYKRQGTITKVEGCQVIEHKEVKTPFSVFKRIYLSARNMQHKEKDVIIKHELSHIHQKHWLDLLCSECALLLQWFNPLMWYYIHLQKENHEYLADEAVLADGESVAVYSAVLINQRFQGPIFSFSNSFNYSNQKNRLTMMKREKTSPWKKIAALAVLPLCGTFIFLSATPNYVMEEEPTTAMMEMKTSELDYKTRVKNLFDRSFEDSAKPPFVVVDGEVFKGGKTEIDQLNIYAFESIGETDISPTLTAVKEKHADALEKHNKKYGTESTLVVTITTKEGVANDPSIVEEEEEEPTMYLELSDAKISGDVITSNEATLVIPSDSFTIHFESVEPQQKDKGLMVTPASKEPTKDYVINFDAPNTGRKNWRFKQINGQNFVDLNPLILIDGKESTKAEIEKLKYNDIEDISVYKSDTPVAGKYGEKAKDGVVEIVTKDGKNIPPRPVKATRKNNDTSAINPDEVTIVVGGKTPNFKPNMITMSGDTLRSIVYIVDDKEMSEVEFNKLSTTDFNSISVLKGGKTTEEYLASKGIKETAGKSAMIIITKEKALQDNGLIITTPRTRMQGFENIPENILVYLDDEEISKTELHKIDPNDIEHIEIMKPGEPKLKEYGDKGKEGVILLTSLKKNKLVGSMAPPQNISKKKEPLVFIDSEEISYEEMSRLSIIPGFFADLKVYKKDNEILNKYGEKAKNGVVLITTNKKNLEEVRQQIAEMSKEFYIIDDKLGSPEEILKLRATPNSIFKSKVYKKGNPELDKLIAKYGDKVADGATIITTSEGLKNKTRQYLTPLK